MYKEHMCIQMLQLSHPEHFETQSSSNLKVTLESFLHV